MALPKLKHPIFSIELPSNKLLVKYRPFLVKEEKILLMAMQGEDSTEIITAIKQVINNCILSEGIDVDELATIDLEYLFIKIRAKSVNNIIKLSYRDIEDEKIYNVEVDLDKVEIKHFDNHSNKIQIDDTTGIMLRYPKAKMSADMNESNSETELFFNIFKNCIDYVYDDNNHYPANEYSDEELEDFLQQLDVKTFKKIQDFFTTMPRLHYEVKYTNSLGKSKVITLSTLNDFFTLG